MHAEKEILEEGIDMYANSEGEGVTSDLLLSSLDMETDQLFKVEPGLDAWVS